MMREDEAAIVDFIAAANEFNRAYARRSEQVENLQSLLAAEQARCRLLAEELQNIVKANVKTWYPETRGDFEEWAKSRARFTLTKCGFGFQTDATACSMPGNTMVVPPSGGRVVMEGTSKKRNGFSKKMEDWIRDAYTRIVGTSNAPLNLFGVGKDEFGTEDCIVVAGRTVLRCSTRDEARGVADELNDLWTRSKTYDFFFSVVDLPRECP